MGRIPSFSEVPNTCFLWYFVPFFFFFSISTRHERFFSVGAPTLTGDFSAGRLEKHSGFIRWALGISLGIYPGPARDIAWDLSGGRSGNRLGFFWWPLRRSPSIFGIALGVSEQVPGHFPFKIPGDLDIRSKVMVRHVHGRQGESEEGVRVGDACCGTTTTLAAARSTRRGASGSRPPSPWAASATLEPGKRLKTGTVLQAGRDHARNARVEETSAKNIERYAARRATTTAG